MLALLILPSFALVPPPQAAPVAAKPIELRGQIRENVAASELIVEADGVISACRPVPRPYHNVAAPPDICASFPMGARYSPPATYRGRPMRRKVRITITTYEENIR